MVSRSISSTDVEDDTDNVDEVSDDGDADAVDVTEEDTLTELEPFP